MQFFMLNPNIMFILHWSRLLMVKMSKNVEKLPYKMFLMTAAFKIECGGKIKCATL